MNTIQWVVAMLLAWAASAILICFWPTKSPGLEISPDAYKAVQWIPPAPPPPGVYMPLPPQPRRYGDDLYQEWRAWGGRPVRPQYQQRMCYDAYRRLVPCETLGPR